MLRIVVRCADPRLPCYLLGGYPGGALPAFFLSEGDQLPVREPVSCAAPCFPAVTEVATTTGQRGIETLRVGERVLAEDPASGAVRPEAVMATIDDGVRPLVAVGLSDGSSILATPNHAFFVDGGPGLARAAWVQAGELQAGDRLRTAGGKLVWVVGLRYHARYARVYTLTVAIDPSTRLRVFFVGSLRWKE